MGVVLSKQEYIPVGCLPSAAVASGGGVYPSMHWTGGCVYPSMHWAGSVYPSMHWAGVCLPRVCLPIGVSAQGYVSAQGGCLPRGFVSQHALGRGVCPGGCMLGVSAWGCVCPGGARHPLPL